MGLAVPGARGPASPLSRRVVMSAVKRKATSAAATEPAAKQQKKGEKNHEGAGAAGWLKDHLKQLRKDNKDMKFNKKRLRFISDAKSMKQGSEGVLYWMLRDHRVQGKHSQQQQQQTAMQQETAWFV